jgi:hypothetical protein
MEHAHAVFLRFLAEMNEWGQVRISGIIVAAGTSCMN